MKNFEKPKVLSGVLIESNSVLMGIILHPLKLIKLKAIL